MEKFFISILPIDFNKEHQLREGGNILMKNMASLLLEAKPRVQRIIIIKSYQMKKNTLILILYILNNINIQNDYNIVKGHYEYIFIILLHKYILLYFSTISINI